MGYLMNSKIIICGIVCGLMGFVYSAFGMDLSKEDHHLLRTALNKSSQEKLQKNLCKTTPCKFDNYEIIISDKDLLSKSLTYFDGQLTITDDTYDIECIYQSGRILSEKDWQNMPLSRTHLHEMALKTNVFYLYAYKKDERDENLKYLGLTRNKDLEYSRVKCCTKIVRVITHRNDLTATAIVTVTKTSDLKDPCLSQKPFWKHLEAIGIFTLSIASFIALYKLGWLDKAVACMKFH